MKDPTRYFTEHFEFISSDNDAGYLSALGAALESCFARVTAALDVAPSKSVRVYIYPDLKSFHRAIGMTDAPDWVVGNAMDGGIHIVSPNGAGSRAFDDMQKVLIHEFVHIVTRCLSGDVYSVPCWLSEGVAVYEAGQLPGRLPADNPPPLSDLAAHGPETFAGLGGYQYAYTLVELIVKRFGYGKLRQLIASPGDMETVLGMSEAEFYALWADYLNRRYPRGN